MSHVILFIEANTSIIGAEGAKLIYLLGALLVSQFTIYRNRAFLRLFLNTLTILWQPFQSWSNAPEGAYLWEGSSCEILQPLANAKLCWV